MNLRYRGAITRRGLLLSDSEQLEAGIVVRASSVSPPVTTWSRFSDLADCGIT